VSTVLPLVPLRWLALASGLSSPGVAQVMAQLGLQRPLDQAFLIPRITSSTASAVIGPVTT
jgi:hypothetical protein